MGISLVLAGCGGDGGAVYKKTPPGGGDVTAAQQTKWDEGTSQVVMASCAVSGCHANGNIVNLLTPKAFLASKAKGKVTNGLMPPPASPAGQAFSAESKATLLAFFE